MPIVTLYKALCDNCGANGGISGISSHDVVAKAVKMGWSSYPLLCTGCARDFKERLRDEQQDRSDVRQAGEGAH